MKKNVTSESIGSLKVSMTFFVFIFVSQFMLGQGIDHYEAKWSLGNPSVGWYKLATFDLAGNGNFNSVIIDAEINYIKTGEIGYAASAKLFFREGAGYNGKWYYEISGTQIGDYLKYKKINDTTYELFGYSNGNWGHMSIDLAITKEAALVVSLPTASTLVPNPDIYADVPKVGKHAFLLDRVGIGTSTPDAALTVKGDIHAEEVKVDLSVPGPDYVFYDDYDLKSLEDVRKYIDENGHLPNIPSAMEMEENGIQLAEMNMKLLEKIEELTLYIMELEEKMKALQKFHVKYKDLESEVESIKRNLNLHE